MRSKRPCGISLWIKKVSLSFSQRFAGRGFFVRFMSWLAEEQFSSRKAWQSSSLISFYAKSSTLFLPIWFYADQLVRSWLGCYREMFSNRPWETSLWIKKVYLSFKQHFAGRFMSYWLDELFLWLLSCGYSHMRSTSQRLAKQYYAESFQMVPGYVILWRSTCMEQVGKCLVIGLVNILFRKYSIGSPFRSHDEGSRWLVSSLLCIVKRDSELFP